MLDLWAAIVPKDRAADDVSFLAERLDLQPGARVLDVPCGDGRVAIEMAARGFAMTGIDISPGMIAAARDRADGQAVCVDLREGEMRDLPADGSFDAAYCWGDSFGYMDDAGNAAFLSSVHGALGPGALFALEIQMLEELLERRYRPADAGSVDDIAVSIRRQWDRGTGRMSVTYDLVRDGTTATNHSSYRIYGLAELLDLVRSAGFGVVECADEAGRPFAPDAARPSDTLRLVCRKQG